MRKGMMLVLVTSGLAAQVVGCGAASTEPMGSTASKLNDAVVSEDGMYVETWDDENVAGERANDMRSVGLTVEQVGTALYVHPAAGSQLDEMMQSASSDYLSMRWGGGDGGGGVVSASKQLKLDTSSLKPKDVTTKPYFSAIDGSIAGSVKMSGHVDANAGFSLSAHSCGRGCFRLEGKAKLDLDAEVIASFDGVVSVGRDTFPIVQGLPLGKQIIILPTPIPIPVEIGYSLDVAVSCGGSVDASGSVRAWLKGGASFGVWSTIDRNSGLDAGITADFSRDGGISSEGSIHDVTFGCTAPEVKITADIYEFGGPFVTVGPRYELSSPYGRPHASMSIETGIGVGSRYLGEMKASGPSFDLGETDL